MMFVCAMRGSSVGADTSHYLESYGNSLSHESYEAEYLFYVVIKTVYEYTDTPEMTQVILSILTFIPYIIIFTKYSKIPTLSLLLFIVTANVYYLEAFNIVRQAAATPYLLLAFINLNNKNKKWFLIWSAVAIGFHTTSILFVSLALIAYYCRFSKKMVSIMILSSLFFAFCISSVDLIATLVEKISDYSLFEGYSAYMAYRLDLARTMNGLITQLLPPSILCVYAFNVIGDTPLLRMFLIGVIVLNIVSIMPTSYRMAYGLNALELLIYPMVLYEYHKNNWLIWCIIVSLCALWLYNLPAYGISGLFPYESFI